MPSGIYLTREQIDYIRKHFADTQNKDLARDLGLSLSTITNIRKKYHLAKSPEHLKAMHRECGLASSRRGRAIELTPDVLRKRAESFKKTYRMEKARVYFGLEQKTKIRVRRRPPELLKQKYYLRMRGYIVDDATMTAFYTDDTRRATRMEANKENGKRKIYYTFKKLEK